MKKVIFVGNRFNVLNVLLKEPEVTLLAVFAAAGSFLEKELIARGLKYIPFALGESNDLITGISQLDFDILVSNGCPFRLPISKLRTRDQLFINTHPSYLPHLKGVNPINGAFLLGAEFFGATTHFMDDSLDTGNIIAQKKIDLTEDLDLGLVYRLSFDLEGEVFAIAFERLKESKFLFQGHKQQGEGSYYTRKAEDLRVDFKKMTTTEILRRVKAFGIKGLGVSADIGGTAYQIFAAEKIFNSTLLQKFQNTEPGTILLSYPEHFLIRTSDGVVKVSFS